MARKKAAQIDDTQRTLSIQSSATDVGSMTVNVPDLLSRTNRRLYQQVRCYEAQVQVIQSGSDLTRRYDVYTLSNAWWVKKSIEMAKAVYLHSTKEERALLGDRRGKWNDFTIETGTYQNYANAFQYSPSTSSDDITAAEVATDETLQEGQSGASSQEGDQDLGADYAYNFTIGTSDSTGSVRSYNIFDQYLLTRQHVTPADTRANPYAELMDLDNSAMESIKKDGDNAPYDLDAFPSPWVLADSVLLDRNPGHATRSVSRMVTAPLGVIMIKKKTFDGSEVNFADNEFLIHVKSGTYKGVHAPAYKATKLDLASSGQARMLR